jgi:hypothetical protein
MDFRRGYDASYSAVIGSKMADIEQFISLAKHFCDFSFRLTGLSHNRDFSLRRSGARAGTERRCHRNSRLQAERRATVYSLVAAARVCRRCVQAACNSYRAFCCGGAMHKILRAVHSEGVVAGRISEAQLPMRDRSWK